MLAVRGLAGGGATGGTVISPLLDARKIAGSGWFGGSAGGMREAV